MQRSETRVNVRYLITTAPMYGNFNPHLPSKIHPNVVFIYSTSPMDPIWVIYYYKFTHSGKQLTFHWSFFKVGDVNRYPHVFPCETKYHSSEYFKVKKGNPPLETRRTNKGEEGVIITWVLALENWTYGGFPKIVGLKTPKSSMFS